MIEVDIWGDGNGIGYRNFDVSAGQTVNHEFPEAFSAYWVRSISDKAATVTALLDYR